MQVVDRTMAVLAVLETGGSLLQEVTDATGLPRSTVYRLLVALRHHGFVESDDERGFTIGPRVRELGAIADGGVLARMGSDIAERLCDATGFSAQLYRLAEGHRECIAAANPFSGLRDVVSAGMRFPVGNDASSHVLTAWSELPVVSRPDSDVLSRVRRQGWSLAVCDSVTALSVPLKAPSGRVIAALSVSGPPRIKRQAVALCAQLKESANLLEDRLLHVAKELHAAPEDPASPPAAERKDSRLLDGTGTGTGTGRGALGASVPPHRGGRADDQDECHGSVSGAHGAAEGGDGVAVRGGSQAGGGREDLGGGVVADVQPV